MSFWQLLQKIDSGELETIQALHSLEQKKLVKTGETISCLKPESKPAFDEKKLLEDFKKLTSGFKPVKAEFYQERVTLQDIVKKTSFMNFRFDLDNADLVFIGDDDCASIAAALTGKPKSITVVEIDETVIEKIEQVSKQNNFGIKCFQYDVLKPLPKSLKEKFDVFITEPPEASFGMESFLVRGLELLKGQGSAGYFGLGHRESSGSKWLSLQKKLTAANAFVSDVLKDFQVYPEFSSKLENFEKMPLSKKLYFKTSQPNLDWWTVSLVRIELAGKAKPWKPKKAKSLFSDEETLTVYF